MIFELPRCPACQRYADRIVEKVYAKIEIVGHGSEDTEFDYLGESETDDQQPVKDELGLVTLQCRCGRHWKTLMLEGDT